MTDRPNRVRKATEKAPTAPPPKRQKAEYPEIRYVDVDIIYSLYVPKVELKNSLYMMIAYRSQLANEGHRPLGYLNSPKGELPASNGLSTWFYEGKQPRYAHSRISTSSGRDILISTPSRP